jgi:hypothetical protein
VGSEDSVISGLVLAGRRYQRGEAAEEGEGLEDELGLAGEPGAAEAVGDLAGGGAAKALMGEGRARAVAEQALEGGAVVGGDGGVGVE